METRIVDNYFLYICVARLLMLLIFVLGDTGLLEEFSMCQ